VLLTWKIAEAGGLITPVVAGMNGIVHVTRPVPALYVGSEVDASPVLVAAPVNVVPDCKYADTVTLVASVA
jgi:hypothetical protein